MIVILTLFYIFIYEANYQERGMQLVLGLNALFIAKLKVTSNLPKTLCYVFVRQSIDPLSCCLSRYICLYVLFLTILLYLL